MRREAPDGAVNLLYFGIIRPFKGVEDLVRAYDAIPEDQAHRFWLTVVGETWEGHTLPTELIAASPRRDRITFVNRYVQDEQPWQLSKDDGQAERLDQVLYSLAEGLRVVSVLLLAFMPASAERLLAALGNQDPDLGNARFGAAPGGAATSEPGQLFPRVEPTEVTAA